VKQKKGEYTESKCQTIAEKKGKPDYKGTYEKIGPQFVGTGNTGVLNTVLRQCYEEPRAEHIVERSSKCNPENLKSDGYYVNEVSEYVECASETNAGRAKGVNELEDVQITFKGCELNGSVGCTNTSTEGEVKVNPVKGHLGYLEKSASPPKVGVLLEPETPGGLFATVTCASGLIELITGAGNKTEGWYYPGSGHDSVMSPITPIDKSSHEFEQVFSANGEDAENEPDHFEGEATIHRLETAFEIEEEPGKPVRDQWARSGESVVNRSVPEGAEEIKA
jgi:hypothetical protein